MHPKHNAHDKGHEKLSKGEADPRCMPREIRKVQVSKNIDALLSYAKPQGNPKVSHSSLE